MKTKVILGLLITLIPLMLVARDAPVTTAGSSSLCPGNATTVPVTVTNFTLIKAVSLRLDYDPTQLSFVNFTDLNPSLGGTFVNDVVVSETLHKIMIAWSSMNALSLSDGSKLLDLNFTLVSGSPIVSFNNTDNGGSDCEYADENGNSMNDLPTADFYIDATITNLGTEDAGDITGPTSLCAGAGTVPYSVLPIANATGYEWTVPAGAAIVSGENSPSIVVDFSTTAVSGNITVAGTNSCGPGISSSLPVTVNPLPSAAGTITGPSISCPGATGITYNVPVIDFATSYSWTVPPGALITSGADTNQIEVTFGASPVTGAITVKGSNFCGIGTVSPDFVVTIDSIEAPYVTADGAVLTSSAPIGNQWFYEGTGAIPGANEQVYTAIKTGWYWASVSLYGCTSDTSNHVYVLFEGQQDTGVSRQFSIFPVPNNGLFTVSISFPGSKSCFIRIWDQIGTIIYRSSEVNKTADFLETIDLRPIPAGIYTVVLQTDDQWFVRKLIVIQ